MPTYAYKCQNCQHELEVFQKIVDVPLSACPKCEKETLRRGPGGGAGTIFAGSGWFKDSYGGGESSACCPCGKKEGSCK